MTSTATTTSSPRTPTEHDSGPNATTDAAHPSEAADGHIWLRPRMIAYDYADTLASRSYRDGGRSGPREQPVWATAARVIRALHDAGIPAMLSSNTISSRDEPRRPQLRAAGIADCFIEVLCSSEHGLAKPDPRWYQLLIDRARRHLPGCGPHDIVHVGDHPIHDVIAAHQAGLRAVLVTGGRTGPWPKLPPDARVITNITELPALFGLDS